MSELSSRVQGFTAQTNDSSFLKGLEVGWLNTAYEYINNPVKSFIYFILAESEGFDSLVKIGLTVDLPRRFKEISSDIETGKYDIDWLAGGTDTLRVLGILEGNQPLETALHKAFKSKAAGREWFWFDDDLSPVIDNLLCDHCVCEPCLIADNITDVTNVTLI
jgi:hypothetical protein